MKRAFSTCLILLLASLQPAGAEDFEPFFRIALRAGYTYILPGIKHAYGPVGEVRAFWGARWYIGVNLQYSHLYDYEHAWDDSSGETVRTPPDIWRQFGGGVVGGYFIGNPQGFGGHVELGCGFYEIPPVYLGLGLDLALGELVGLSLEAKGIFPFCNTVILGVTFFIP